MKIKKIIYITLFTSLGILTQFLLHGILEVWYQGLLLKDFATYSLGQSWSEWILIHNAGAVLFLVAGTLLGYQQGHHWYKKIYERPTI